MGINMKIIFTVNTYFPLKDGVQAVTQYQAEGLAKRGHDVLVVTSSIKDVPDKAMLNLVKIVRKDIHTIHAVHRGNKTQYQNYILKITENADILINVCLQTAFTDWLLPILHKISCKKFLYMHGMIDFSWNGMNFSTIGNFTHKFWNNMRWTYLYKMQSNRIKKYDIISQLHEFDYGYQYFKKHYGIQCTVLENAADNAFFLEEINKNYQAQNQYIICIANYIERKNQLLCLEAFYRSNIDECIKLIFIGSHKTSYYYQLLEQQKRLEKKFGKKHVDFLAGVPRNEISEYVRKASLYLLGSKWEAYPVSIVEAMASGVPFITTNVGCVRFFPGGVVINNCDEMAYWIRNFFENSEMARKLGQAGRIYAMKNMTIQSKQLELEELILLEIYKKNSLYTINGLF